MKDKTITKRPQYWLDHLKAAEAANSSLVAYAKAKDLKVKDLYQWKTTLIKRGFLSSPQSAFTAICSLVLPSGIRLELQGATSTDLLQELVSSASQLS